MEDPRTLDVNYDIFWLGPSENRIGLRRQAFFNGKLTGYSLTPFIIKVFHPKIHNEKLNNIKSTTKIIAILHYLMNLAAR